jgi:hypothetical protein
MKTLLIVETEEGRERLLRNAEEELGADEAIVEVTDEFGEDSATLTVPKDPNAEIVAREPPCVEARGVTTVTSYVRLDSDSLEAVEHEVEDDEIVATREVTLEPERVGRPRPQPGA